jgi:hypothetical protein
MLGGVFCEPLDVTLQIIAHFLDSRKDSASNLCRAPRLLRNEAKEKRAGNSLVVNAVRRVLKGMSP